MLSRPIGFRQRARTVSKFSQIRISIVGILIFIVAFVLAAVVELKIRELQRTPIKIVVGDDVKADVEGEVMPDLFWAGKAWYIRIDCDQPVSVAVDGRWTARVPAGKHIIYHNHDSNNTTKFSPTRWREPPTVVTVSKF